MTHDHRTQPLVLVVDDVPENLHLMKAVLGRDYTVVTAASGKEALRIAYADHPDLILLDVMMQDMDGYEVCRLLKADEETCDTPVIFVTAVHNEESEEQGFRLGAVDYMIKPIVPSVVRARVRTHLNLELARAEAKEHLLELTRINEELIALNKELSTAQSQLFQSEKMASLGQLAAGVAHEINNPIGFIISNLSSLRHYMEKMTAFLDVTRHIVAECGPSPAEIYEREAQKHKIEYIRQDLPDLIRESLEGAERVRTIVQELKSFSRIDKSEFACADIHDGLESALSIAWNELKYKTQVVKEYGEVPPVWCNLGQLNQVFMNLLVNAAQAIESQGTITLRTGHENGQAVIAISDTGSGIPPETQKRIFDPFFTTKDVGKGTGLGLAIVYDIIVNKHGGHIAVTSDVGKGTTFTIRLPVAKASEQPSIPAATA